MKILIAGDYVPINRVDKMMSTGDFSYFDEVKALTAAHDCSIINLEAPIVTKNPIPIKKCGPNLKTSDRAAESIAYAGFNMATLANNHVLDYGKNGLNETISSLEQNGIMYVGAGHDIKSSAQIKYYTKGDKTLGIINCCEHEFSIATQESAGANPLNIIAQTHAIQEAREKADYVILIIHGGHEHFQYPSLRMVETYRFFIEMGADAVVNHHQHCFSGYEEYNGKPIFYGIGNFCFDKGPGKGLWNEGYMVSLNFNNHAEWEIFPYIQCDKNPIVTLKAAPDDFRNRLAIINHTISDEKKLREKVSEYYRSESSYISSVFEPYSGRLSRFLFHRGLLPSFFKNEKLRHIQNYVQCESHLDKVSFMLNSSCNSK